MQAGLRGMKGKVADVLVTDDLDCISFLSSLQLNYHEADWPRELRGLPVHATRRTRSA